jgi:hypothetical protein
MAKRVEVLKNVALIGGWQKDENEEEEEEPFAFDPFITRFSRGRGKKRKDDDKTPGLVPGADTSAYPQTNKEKKEENSRKGKK